MRYLFFSNQTWREPAGSPHRLLPLLLREHAKIFSPEAGRKAAPLTIAAVGAGGKTSLLMQLMQECLQLNLQVMVTTTTHMFLPEARLMPAISTDTNPWSLPSPFPCPDRNPVFLGRPSVPSVRQKGWIKCGSPDPELFWKLYPDMDVILVEADGSKRLPVKIPASWEPVIPDCTDLILAVYGLSSLGKPLEKCCHRWQLLEKTFSIPDPHSEDPRLETLPSRPENPHPGTLSSRPEDPHPETLPSRPEDPRPETLSSRKITPKLLGTLMKQNYLEPLGKKYGYPSVIPVWNQADTQVLTEAGKLAAACCGASLQLITAF